MLERFEHIVVTGGCGFVGHHLVEELAKAGKSVSVIDNCTARLKLLCPTEISYWKIDIRDKKALHSAMRGAQLVIHPAANANGSISVLDPDYDYEVNAIGTANVAEAAANTGAKRFVYVSSAAVYGRPGAFPISEDHPTAPFLPYGTSKLAGEQICKKVSLASGLPVIIARPFCLWPQGTSATFTCRSHSISPLALK